MFSYQHWKHRGYNGGTTSVCEHDPRPVMLSTTRAAREDSNITRTAAALRGSGFHSTSGTATAALMDMPDARPTRSTPVHTGEPFCPPAPAKYMLWTTHEGNYWVLRMVAEINIFPLLSNIFFDIF